MSAGPSLSTWHLAGPNDFSKQQLDALFYVTARAGAQQTRFAWFARACWPTSRVRHARLAGRLLAGRLAGQVSWQVTTRGRLAAGRLLAEQPNQITKPALQIRWCPQSSPWAQKYSEISTPACPPSRQLSSFKPPSVVCSIPTTTDKYSSTHTSYTPPPPTQFDQSNPPVVVAPLRLTGAADSHRLLYPLL